ncbi:hypothetical protein [carnivorous sponge associated iridovirus]|jgi:hypothetical protein|nr:hypothetical protein [carnivorous sponge associated iridovirus]
MKDIYFFSCENIAIISSNALKHYPQIESYVSTHVKPTKSVLFFAMKEPFVTKSTFNGSTPVGFANNVIEGDQVRVTPLLAIGNDVKKRLLEYIINFFTIPIVIEVSLNSQDWLNDVTFFSNLGFGDPTPSPNNNRTIDMKLVPSSNHVDTLNKVMSIAQSATFLCKLKVFFPKTLSNTLISYLSEPSEVGGKICITRYAKDSEGTDVAVLGFNTSELVPGNKDSFTVNIPPDKVAPFSFHTHPDVCYTSYGCFLGWPSGPDIAFVVGNYLENRDILVHFVISSEGIWVIHLRPQFQRLLYELKNQYSTEECQKKLVEFIKRSFIFLEGQRRYEMISPADRAETRRKFIETSKNLKISDYRGTEVEPACSPFIREDALLFDIDLIKWKTFESNKVIMTFSYIADPVGGLPCLLPVDCAFLAPIFVD